MEGLAGDRLQHGGCFRVATFSLNPIGVRQQRLKDGLHGLLTALPGLEGVEDSLRARVEGRVETGGLQYGAKSAGNVSGDRTTRMAVCATPSALGRAATDWRIASSNESVVWINGDSALVFAARSSAIGVTSEEDALATTVWSDRGWSGSTVAAVAPKAISTSAIGLSLRSNRRKRSSPAASARR
jgi:hypothetical protein